MGNSFENLRGFQNLVASAKSSATAEEYVREMIRGAADSAPIDAIVRLGKCLASIRKDELRSEGETN